MVRIIQNNFDDGAVPEDLECSTMVFLPKGRRGGYRLIGIGEVVWKVCVVVFNCWLKRSMTLHYALHGFRAGRGTGTATLE